MGGGRQSNYLGRKCLPVCLPRASRQIVLSLMTERDLLNRAQSVSQSETPRVDFGGQNLCGRFLVRGRQTILQCGVARFVGERPILVVGLDSFRFAAIAALFALLLGPRMHGINFARRSPCFSFEMWVYRGTEISTPLAKNHFCWHLRDHHMPMVAIRFLA